MSWSTPAGPHLMERNAVHVSDFFSLPNDQVVEIGRQVAI